MSELVTGEAVVLDIRLARLATRAIAIGIDFVLQFAALFLLTIPIGYVAEDAGAGPSLIAGLNLLVTVGIFVGYTTAIETLTRGKSIGKYALGLRVVRDDGGPIRFRHAFVRALAGIFVDFILVGCVALFTALFNAKCKRIGDLLAGTIVIRERAPRVTEALPQVPPALASWAARADLSRVPDHLAMAARSFLGRFHELSPAARDALGNRMAGGMAEYVSPPPPPGVPAWAYLTAVLAERRRRALESQASPGMPRVGGPYGQGQPVAVPPPPPQQQQQPWPPPSGSPAQPPPPAEPPAKPDRGFAPPG